MADLARIKRNVSKMVSQSAPETDIDQYIDSEGVTIDQIKAFPVEALDPTRRGFEPSQFGKPVNVGLETLKGTAGTIIIKKNTANTLVASYNPKRSPMPIKRKHRDRSNRSI